MGKPVKIRKLAERMVLLSGLTIKSENNKKGDIEIIETGLRPGEKIFEELYRFKSRSNYSSFNLQSQ